MPKRDTRHHRVDGVVSKLFILYRSLAFSGEMLEVILIKAQFGESRRGECFNPRQHLMINRFLDGFKGKLASSKWAKIGKCSKIRR